MTASHGSLDRSTPPATTTRSTFSFPSFLRERRGRLEVLILERPDLPIVSLSLLAPAAGAQSQTDAEIGLASLTASAVTEGTRRLSSADFASRAEHLGGFVNSGADWDSASIHSGCLVEHLPALLDLTVEAYLEPAFRTADVQRLINRRLSEFARRATDPGAMASTELLRRIYPGTVYGSPLIGTAEALGDVSADGTADYWRRLAGRRACLVLAGAVSADAVAESIWSRLEELAGGEPGVAATTELVPPAHAGPTVYLVDRPSAAQTELLMGHPGPGRCHPDRPALRLLNTVLGGKFSSRINLNLRERHGYTYGAHSGFSGRSGPGPFTIRSAVENEFVGAAVAEVLGELHRIRAEAVGREELEDARSYLVGVQPYLFQTLNGWTSALGTLAALELDDDWYDRQQAALLAVSAEDVLAAAQEHLQPERLAIVVVGPADQLEPQFRDLETVLVPPSEASA